MEEKKKRKMKKDVEKENEKEDEEEGLWKGLLLPEVRKFERRDDQREGFLLLGCPGRQMRQNQNQNRGVDCRQSHNLTG